VNRADSDPASAWSGAADVARVAGAGAVPGVVEVRGTAIGISAARRGAAGLVEPAAGVAVRRGWAASGSGVWAANDGGVWAANAGGVGAANIDDVVGAGGVTATIVSEVGPASIGAAAAIVCEPPEVSAGSPRRSAPRGASTGWGIGVGAGARAAIDGITNRGPALGGTVGDAAAGGSTAGASPIATHSASALTASIRPCGAGGIGRGAAGISAGRGEMLGGAGFIASRAFSSSASIVLLVASGSRKRSVMPTRPWSTEAVRAEPTTSARPSIITPPSLSVTANRARWPIANGSAIGTNRPFLSAYRRNAATNSSPVAHAETR